MTLKHIFVAALLTGTSVAVFAQNPASTNKKTNGITSGADQTATGSADGLKRRGNGQESPKMKAGVSRSGNSNLSPTGPTNTHGSTSEGSASVPSAGGAGTRQARGGVKGAQNTKNNTASDGGATTGPGATGANRRKAADAAYPQPTGSGKNGTQSTTAKGHQGQMGKKPSN